MAYLPHAHAHPMDVREADTIQAVLEGATLAPEMAQLIAQTFQAVADPTRARIVYALTRGEHSVGQLSAIAGVSPSATSHHLKQLRDLRIVTFRREGTHVFYTVDDAHVAALFREALYHVVHVVNALTEHPEGAS